MKVQALIIFMTALTAQYRSTRVLSTDPGPPEHTGDPGFTRRGLSGYPIMEQRDVHDLDFSEDSSLCFFLREKDAESQISCKPRLTRSKFNYNPFGLRFGKRDRRLKPDRDGSRTTKLLPILLLARELEERS
ncbi:kisspeptin 2 [Brachyhypopomus gauderio]|uniref:kisspeptin 2 n=1 Tax=Brachyhypopomus gauderio TaxID=698409 RepID=UPI0040434623